MYALLAAFVVLAHRLPLNARLDHTYLTKELIPKLSASLVPRANIVRLMDSELKAELALPVTSVSKEVNRRLLSDAQTICTVQQVLTR